MLHRRVCFLGSAAVLLGVLGHSRHALAQEVRYDLDSATALEADGWKQWATANESMSFSGGELLIDTQGYSQWLLYEDSGARWFSASSL